ncbi:MAG: hypothetical protein GY804_01130 [Alphaproteobacteria bacterium]|nr:hypothetical protein [Alphaproteobacteria bacterium]
MRIEIPVIWEQDDLGSVDSLIINLDKIYAFNPSNEGTETTIRIDGFDTSFIVACAFADFKSFIESIEGEISSIFKIKELFV